MFWIIKESHPGDTGIIEKLDGNGDGYEVGIEWDAGQGGDYLYVDTETAGPEEKIIQT